MGKRDVMDLQTAESIARDQVVGGTSVLGPRATAALLAEIDRLRTTNSQLDSDNGRLSDAFTNMAGYEPDELILGRPEDRV